MGFKKALKTLEILEKPEVIFNRRLLANPYHPFEKLEGNSKWKQFKPLRPNSDLSRTSHCNSKGLSVSEVMRIENMITQVKSY